MILGIEDPGVVLAYVCTIGAAALCVVYGIVNWNKPAITEEKKEIEEEIKWEEHGTSPEESEVTK